MIDTKVEVFLEHHGVKGQKWGFRRAFGKGKQGDWRKRSGGQKVGLVTSGVVGYEVAGTASNVAGHIIARRIPAAALAVPFANIAAGTVGAILGARFTRNILQKKGKKKLSSSK